MKRLLIVLALLGCVGVAIAARPITTVASIQSNWIDTLITPTTADNSGNVVVQPNAITRTPVGMGEQGTTFQVTLKYLTSGTVTTSPVVQLFGKDGGGIYQRLVDVDGVHELTLSVDTTNDVRDGTYSYTQPVEVDADACANLLVTVKTALAGSSLTGTGTAPAILVRIK